MSMVYVLLVIEDDLIANRFAGLVGLTSSIIRFKDCRGAQEWLTDGQKVDLIFTDKKNGYAMATMIRTNTAYKLVPFLITTRLGESPFEQPLLPTGITDILLINEDNHRLQAKIRYYLGLSTQIQMLDQSDNLLINQPFILPRWKRLLDISVSLVLLVLLSPVLLIISLLIRIDSKGPVIYKSKRAGTNFHVFDMYKFRTMTVEADQLIDQLASYNLYQTDSSSTNVFSEGEFVCDSCRQKGLRCQQLLVSHSRPVCEKFYLTENKESAKFMKFRNDPRVTRLGTILRNSSIDELPQLVNILLGDMSLVGNRPLPLYEAEKLTSNEFARRFAGPSGLTGLWQIRKRAKGQGAMSDQERTLLDIEYSTSFSFKTDIQIIWETFFSIWQKENV